MMRPGLLIAACLFANGCTVGPDYKRPDVDVPEQFTTQQASELIDLSRWWTAFNDPTLNDLIDRAVVSNLDLRLATARLREARALRGVVGADLWPDVNVAGS